VSLLFLYIVLGMYNTSNTVVYHQSARPRGGDASQSTCGSYDTVFGINERGGGAARAHTLVVALLYHESARCSKKGAVIRYVHHRVYYHQ
jgi:hypothetical protein